LTYPEPHLLGDYNANSGYSRIRRFASATKAEQRFSLSDMGYPIPNVYVGSRPNLEGHTGNRKFVVRPLRHSGGREYRTISLEEAQSGSWNPTTEYISELYPKDHEYRILIVRGNPLITLLKRVPEATPQEAPWNHACGATFVTVTDWSLNRLRHTDVYDQIQNNQDFFKNIDLAGLDVLVNLDHDPQYVVCELNLCPSLSIPSNLEKVKDYVLSVPRQS